MKNPSPLHILQICSSSATSGAERHVYSLSTKLQKRGHQVSVATPGHGWLTSILEQDSIPVARTRMKGTGWFRTVGMLTRLVRRNKVQVIHAHLTRSAYIGYLVGMVTGVPVITSVHIANHDQIYRRLARRKNRLVAVSNFVAGMLHGQGVPERYIDTIYNGTDFIDIEATESTPSLEELGVPRDRRIVGLIGKVCRDKGQVEMIHAMGAIREQHPDAHLLLVGRLDEDYRGDIDRAIAESGTQERVTLTGVRHDIPALLDAFTLSTLPSRMETFGVAAIEAMARGKAVVASKVGALPEVVRHGSTGLLVDLRPESIAEAVSYLLRNDGEREEMGRRGRMLVEQKFSLAEMATRFESVYRRAATE